jgi:hypothetical protein
VEDGEIFARILVNRYFASVSRGVERTDYLIDFLEFSDGCDEVAAALSHSSNEEFLDVILGSGGDAVVVLHDCQQCIRLF